MSYFCDIPSNKLSSYIELYGDFGIGLDKERWCISKGIQPIKYVNPAVGLENDDVKILLRT